MKTDYQSLREAQRAHAAALLAPRVGRSTEALRGSIDDLYQTPPEVIASLRALDDATRWLALEHLATSEQRRYLKEFESEVVCGGAALATWRRSILWKMHAPPVADLLSSDVASLVEGQPIASAGLGVWIQFTLDRADWLEWGGFIFAPARYKADATYADYALGVKGAYCTSPAEMPPFTQVGDLRVATLRWVASHAADHLLVGGRDRGIDPEAAIAAGRLDEAGVAALLGGAAAWSADAWVAVRALLREYREFGLSDACAPGFRAPDAWYLTG